MIINQTIWRREAFIRLFVCLVDWLPQKRNSARSVPLQTRWVGWKMKFKLQTIVWNGLWLFCESMRNDTFGGVNKSNLLATCHSSKPMALCLYSLRMSSELTFHTAAACNDNNISRFIYGLFSVLCFCVVINATSWCLDATTHWCNDAYMRSSQCTTIYFIASGCWLI